MPITESPVIDVPAAAPSSAKPPIPAAQTTTRDALTFLRDAMIIEPVSPVPEGWRLYATQKFLGRTALSVWMLTAASAWIAERWLTLSAIPILFSKEAALFGLPVAALGAWMTWTAEKESEAEGKRRWPGRLYAGAVLYLALQVAAALLSFLWITVLIPN